MKNNTYPKIVKQTVNLGNLPYFDGKNTNGEKIIKYHEDNWVEKFPRVVSLIRVNDALEINLFMEHRYRGKFMPSKHGGRSNTLGGITLLTVGSIANSMCIFLQWIEENDINWQEVYAISDSEKAKYWLPVYRYRKNLINKVISNVIDRDTANLYMNHVRQFYEWAFKQRRIDKIPFKYETKIIKKKRIDGDIDLLFTNYAVEEKGITITTTDLLIPRKYKQKKGNNSELSPYSKKEIQELYSTSALAKNGAKLKVDLAILAGLRASEVASFLASYTEDPRLSNKKSFFVEITGKFNKLRTVIVSRHLMQSLWEYANCEARQYRLEKWQMKHGNCDGAPLFLNRSGDQILAKSVGNLIFIASKELSEKGFELNKSFHDLRATFATNLAGFMLKNDCPIGFIQHKLMGLMGHTNFSTTQKYINFSQSETFDKQMAPWVDKLFGEDLEPLQEILLESNGDNKDA